MRRRSIAASAWRSPRGDRTRARGRPTRGDSARPRLHHESREIDASLEPRSRRAAPRRIDMAGPVGYPPRVVLRLALLAGSAGALLAAGCSIYDSSLLGTGGAGTGAGGHATASASATSSGTGAAGGT